MRNQLLTILTTKKLIVLIVIVAVMLLIPFIAMQFTNEVTWSLSDFVVAAALLTATGLAIIFALAKFRNTLQRWGVICLIMLVLLLVWLELAVGIMGSPFAGS